jgi:hypothetical protein
LAEVTVKCMNFDDVLDWDDGTIVVDDVYGDIHD